jgi:Sulfotransferase domain
LADVRPFDFLVIGANRCGTTSLWRALDSHPQIRVPSDKEREFFSSDERYARGLEHYVRRTFPDLREEERAGAVTPQLMAPKPQVTRTIVERIQATCPDVKLIALLRDPIERAVSQLRRMKKISDGKEESFDEFIERVAAKRGGIDKIPLILASDYGRILRHYYEAFPKEQIRAFFTADLDRDPATFYRQVFEHIGVDPTHDPGTPRVHLGGTSKRVSQETMDELLAEMDSRNLLPEDENARRGFGWWLRHLWNTEPDQQGTEISPELRRQLAERYLADAEVLEGLIGAELPWIGPLSKAVTQHAAQ